MARLSFAHLTFLVLAWWVNGDLETWEGHTRKQCSPEDMSVPRKLPEPNKARRVETLPTTHATPT